MIRKEKHRARRFGPISVAGEHTRFICASGIILAGSAGQVAQSSRITRAACAMIPCRWPSFGSTAPSGRHRQSSLLSSALLGHYREESPSLKLRLIGGGAYRKPGPRCRKGSYDDRSCEAHERWRSPTRAESGRAVPPLQASRARQMASRSEGTANQSSLQARPVRGLIGRRTPFPGGPARALATAPGTAITSDNNHVGVWSLRHPLLSPP